MGACDICGSKRHLSVVKLSQVGLRITCCSRCLGPVVGEIWVNRRLPQEQREDSARLAARMNLQKQLGKSRENIKLMREWWDHAVEVLGAQAAGATLPPDLDPDTDFDTMCALLADLEDDLGQEHLDQYLLVVKQWEDWTTAIIERLEQD